ncbi:dethiobiotin synthase [Mycolicibacterium elephantis]|uniref:ATP-dependent dethiobiotin synthetase BioD n=1 Tax=Mycolicibacterium elephantis DSM 44368 TaxID=1335622 RepID=A0A439DPL5_9MYCO|nr:dethiobiotin synthase [Mycolicibacterium elephantis]MCV7219762.1 ATP-dependent dethiobiotin synthetase BioD [Mycolicibacterium elephantis]RWA17501.1 dithiobiotin synthetase [Mycolicibacterium elephantis DSM 44368]
MSTLVITGTDTGVGKTVTTAALACAARLAGIDVAVCKPVQTGSSHDDDLADVARLSRVTALHGGWRYPEPLAPVAAAHRAGTRLPTRTELVDSIRDVTAQLVLVEGAGGLLVELAEGGATLRDVARDLGAPVLVVAAAGLGTLNHTALTLEALDGQGIPCAGLVIGGWPQAPGRAEEGNREALAALAPLRGVLPAGAGAFSAAQFEAMSATAFDTDWISGLA